MGYPYQGPIWRPNAFFPEEWDKLNQDEQIQWWKHAGQKKSSTPYLPDPMKVVEGYLKGERTRIELGAIFPRLLEQNVETFVAQCPKDILDDLQQRIHGYPPDDDEKAWAEMIFTGGVCYAPWTSAEEIRQSQEQEKKMTRNGVRVLRAYLARQTSSP